MSNLVANVSQKDMTRVASHVTKFDGTNFSFWKFQIGLVLEHNGVLPVVLGEEIKPKPVNITDTNNRLFTTNDREIKLWCQKDNSAKICIVSSLELDPQRLLINCKTSNEMWKRLSSQYERAAQENPHALIQHFYNYQYDNKKNVMDHVTAIETIARQLEDIGSPLTEPQIITKILCTLPPSFRPVISSWENLEDKMRTLDRLITRLVKEEELNKRYGADAAYSIKQSGTSSTQAKSANKERVSATSTFHGRSGYVEDSKEIYPTKENHQAKLGHKREVTFQQCSEDSSTFSACPPDGYWYADSVAAQHMTDQKCAFSHFQSIKPGTWPVTKIGTNRRPLQVHGIGTVHVSGLVEGKELHGVLQKVLYVPNLGANLFSIRSATRNGFDVRFSGSGVKVLENEKVLVVGSVANNNMYRLNLAVYHNESDNITPEINTTGKRMVTHARAQKLTDYPEEAGPVDAEFLSDAAPRAVADIVVVSHRPNRLTPKLMPGINRCNVASPHHRESPFFAPKSTLPDTHWIEKSMNKIDAAIEKSREEPHIIEWFHKPIKENKLVRGGSSISKDNGVPRMVWKPWKFGPL